MAIAGKVAITLSTENGGAWSADVTYDRLVAVKHNNNLYISRKAVANVEPPNDEFWFLALEGFGGEDVEALIDRMNELSDLIQAILDGTTQVGNAKTLDGHGAEYFATAVDLSNYLPKSGGTVSADSGQPLILNNSNSGSGYTGLLFRIGNANKLWLGSRNNVPTLSTDLDKWHTILHTGNKPTGTYTGNGDATARTIATGGIGKLCMVRSGKGFALISPNGIIVASETGVTYLTADSGWFSDGELTLKSGNVVLNENGRTYYYQVL